jgi:hypothetical protein
MKPRRRNVIVCPGFICCVAVACLGVWAGVARGAPVNNPLLNDIWVDPISQRSYDNMMEAAVSEQREMTQRYVQQSDFMLQMYMGAMIKQQVKREAGRTRIAQGQATTGFVPAEASPIAARLAAKFTDPKQRAVAAQAVVGQLGHFQSAAAARGGMVKSDAADIFAVAFVLDFEVVNDGSGSAPGAARRKWLAERFRQRLLVDEVFQGTPDVERQMNVEQTALAAQAAVERLAAAKQENDSYARRLARDAAQANLNQFKGLWGHPPTGVELTEGGFGDRGERLRAQGKATPAFQVTSEPMWPALLAVTPVSAGGGADAAKKAADDLRAFGEHAQRAGTKLNNLADITALCVKLLYEVHAGRVLTDRQYASTVQLFTDFYLTDPMWTGLPDDGRQLACEQAEVAALRNWREYRRIVEVELPKQLAAAGYTTNLNLTNGWEAKRQLDGIFAFGGLKFDDYTLTEEGFIPHHGERLIKEGKATTAFHPSPGGGADAAKRAAEDLKPFAELARQRHVPTDDMAHVAALSVAIDFAILTGKELSDSQYRAVVKLLGRRYLEDPRWAALPDFARQELAESWETKALQIRREYRNVIDVEMPKKKAEYRAMLHVDDPKTLDSWTANMADVVRHKARWQIDELFAPLKFDDYRLTDDGVVAVRQ